MIAAYLLKLAVALPLIAGMIWATIWVVRRAQTGLSAGHGTNRVTEPGTERSAGWGNALRGLFRGTSGGLLNSRGKPSRAPLAVVDAVSMGAAGKIALVAFDDRRLLVAVTKHGMTLISEAAPRMPFADLVTMTLSQGETPHHSNVPRDSDTSPPQSICDQAVARQSGLNWAMVR